MKIQVTQENLNKAISAVARVAVSARNPLPILNNILLRTENNRITISATNLEIAITEHIGAKVTHEGAITVPAKLFQEFISSLPSGTIDIETKDHKCTVTSGNYKSVINGMLADDFPTIPKIEKGTDFSLSSRDLKKSLQQVIVAASSDDTRPVLTAVYIHTHEGGLYFVATDSYRLAEKRVMDFDGTMSLLVPSSALSDLLRIVGDQEEDVVVSTDSQQVVFRVGDSELVSRLIDGNYPDYRKLIPSTFANTASVPKDQFTSITKVSSLFARESAGSITLVVDELKKQITINSVASQLGENTSSVDGEISGDGDVTINSKYLLDALGVIGSKQISFAFNGKVEPCVLKGADLPDYTHVIMPLKS
jgi:DNA polymerase III subunit beta